MELIYTLPKGNLRNKPYQKYEFYLADEILRDPEFYREYVCGTPGYKILDNSLNELGYSMSLEQLNEAASIIKPNEVVYPDSIDPEESNELFYKCKESIWRFKELVDLKKMAVVHARTWYSAFLRAFEYSDNGADVVAFSKIVPEELGSKSSKYDGRVTLASCLNGSRCRAEIHFLGFAGFDEFQGLEFVSKYIRSMDSRVFFESEDLWSHRNNILSNVSLDYDRAIEDIDAKMASVQMRYNSYGLC